MAYNLVMLGLIAVVLIAEILIVPALLNWSVRRLWREPKLARHTALTPRPIACAFVLALGMSLAYVVSGSAAAGWGYFAGVLVGIVASGYVTGTLPSSWRRRERDR